MTDVPAPAAKPLDRCVPLQFLLVIDVGVRVLIWFASLALALFVVGRYAGWPQTAGSRLGELSVAAGVALRIVYVIALFNVAYLLWLIALRLLVPNPRPGTYSIVGPDFDPSLIRMSMLWVLTKARYQPPFPAIFVPQLANLAPFRWLFNWRFGPRSQSVFFVEPHILDPSFITIGKNVTIGFGATVSAHILDNKDMMFEPTVIEDDVMIGGHVTLAGGVRVKRGAVIRAYSLVLPGTTIGEDEYWAGIPARRVRDLKPAGAEAS